MGKHTATPWTIHHTPGPWRIGDAGWTVFGPPNGNPSPKTVANVKSKRDARLIAAAPDLLSTLRGIQTLIKDGGDIRDMVSWVDAAIALAQAEENET